LGAVGTLLRGWRGAQPVLDAVRRAERDSAEGGLLSVLPGDPSATDRLRALLGAPTGHPPPAGAVLVHPAVPGRDPGEAAEELAHHLRRGGAGALAILVGPRAEREPLEEPFLATGRLEASNLAHASSLEGPGGRSAVAGVLRVLGDDALAAGRRYRPLRRPVAQALVARAARRAGVIGAVSFPPGADLPALMLLQVGLIGQLAVLHDRPLGPERAVEAAAVAGAAFGWRALARAGAGLVPGPGWALRGGIAYATTRALGETVLLRLERGEDLVPERVAQELRQRLGGVFGRIGLG